MPFHAERGHAQSGLRLASLMGRMRGAPGSASPHMRQMALFCGLPRMTLSPRPAFLIRRAASLIRSSFSSQNSSCR
jgi:hypothetical protein